MLLYLCINIILFRFVSFYGWVGHIILNGFD
jgi:hypothetical protein